jgi:hypothetical protein
MNNIFGTLSLDTLPDHYGDDRERADELGGVSHHHSAADEYGGFFDAKIFRGKGWGTEGGEAEAATAAAPAAPGAPAAPAAAAGVGKYPDLKAGQWVMSQGNAARIIRDGWVYAQWPDNSVTVLENEKGEELNTPYDKDSVAAKNLLLKYGPFQTPNTQASSAPAAKAAAPTSQRGAGLGNFVAAVLPAVMQIWGPKEEPVVTAAPTESSSTGTFIAVGIGALVLIGGAAFLMRGRGNRSED